MRRRRCLARLGGRGWGGSILTRRLWLAGRTARRLGRCRRTEDRRKVRLALGSRVDRLGHAAAGQGRELIAVRHALLRSLAVRRSGRRRATAAVLDALRLRLVRAALGRLLVLGRRRAARGRLGVRWHTILRVTVTSARRSLVVRRQLARIRAIWQHMGEAALVCVAACRARKERTRWTAAVRGARALTLRVGATRLLESLLRRACRARRRWNRRIRRSVARCGLRVRRRLLCAGLGHRRLRRRLRRALRGRRIERHAGRAVLHRVHGAIHVRKRRRHAIGTWREGHAGPRKEHVWRARGRHHSLRRRNDRSTGVLEDTAVAVAAVGEELAGNHAGNFGWREVGRCRTLVACGMGGRRGLRGYLVGHACIGVQGGLTYQGKGLLVVFVRHGGGLGDAWVGVWVSHCQRTTREEFVNNRHMARLKRMRKCGPVRFVWDQHRVHTDSTDQRGVLVQERAHRVHIAMLTCNKNVKTHCKNVCAPFPPVFAPLTVAQNSTRPVGCLSKKASAGRPPKNFRRACRPCT